MPTLEAFAGDTRIFHSDGHWLHPLFALQDFLATRPYVPATVWIRDKITGRAAALLVVHLGLGRVESGLLSQLGQEIFDHYGIPYHYDRLVPRIACQTENLLKDITDPQVAYRLLKARAARSAADTESSAD